MVSKVFEGVNYYLAEKNVQEPDEVKQLLKRGGAVREFYMSDLVTHIITDSPLDPTTTINPDITIIHSDWVKMSMKCEVMLPTAPFELSDDKLFSGLVFCPSKLSRSDTEKLCILVAYYRGRMQRRLDANVTHLVTMGTTGAKYECAVKHSDTVKIVTPDWVLDCIDLGKRLAEGDYHPSPTPPTAGDSPTNGSRGDGGNAACGGVTSPECNGEAETSVRTRQLDKQKISSCASNASEAAGVVDLPVEDKEGLDSKLPAEKEGEERGGPEVGRRGGICKAAVESIGELRLRVKLKYQATSVNEETPDKSTTFPGSNTSRLTQAGNSSPTLKSTTATPHPELLPQLLQGMTFFFTDYQECMDSETIAKWKEVVVQHGGCVLEEYDPEQCTHLLALHKKSTVFDRALEGEKCIASAHWLNDVLTDQKMYPPRHALHFPTAFKWQLPGAENYSITLTNYTDLERELVKDMIRITGIPYTGFLCKETTHLVCRRAMGKKYSKAVEWGVQVVNASFLTDIIHDGQVPAVPLPQHTTLGRPDEFSPNTCFEAARLLKPWEAFMSQYPELHPGLVDREATQSSLQAPPSSSHKRGRGQEAGGSDEEMKKLKLSSDGDGNQSEHAPVSQRGPPTVLFTGISQPVVKKLKTIVQRLGGVVTDRARECTHIVAPRITRTVKFLCGISVCKHIVTPEWLERSGRGVQFTEEAAFALCDHDAEEMFGMNLAASLARAKGKKLLEGLCFYSTPHVQPPQDSLREIIECAGGELLSRIDVDRRFGEQFINLPSSTEQFIVISCPEDVDGDHCSDFIRHSIAVYNAEFVLTGVLKQELDFSQNKIVH